ncbi:MAG: glycosyltransferase family 29 protein [Granulosicoccus sp.]
MKWLIQAPHDWERAWLGGSWSPELCDAAWTAVDAYPSARNLYLALRVQHAISGLKQHHLDYTYHLVGTLKNPWRPVTLRLLCANLQRRNTETADALIDQFLQGPITPLRAYLLSGFPLALVYLLEKQPERFSKKLRKLAEDALDLKCRSQQMSMAFMQSLAIEQNKSCTVAVVGNGPGVLERRDGAFIDDHDVVVRFNAAAITSAYQPHVGNKTDLWVVSPALPASEKDLPAKAIAISGINPFAGRSKYWRTVRSRRISTIAQFSADHWYELVNELAAPPSAGILLLKSLARYNSRLEINIFGFSRPVDLASQTPGAHYSDSRRGSTRHNWHSEAHLLERLISIHR